MSTYYIAPDGNDKNAGSKEKPWKTFAHALKQVKAGDTVLVRSGLYHEVVNIKCANTTWKSEDPNRKPVLDGGYSPSVRRFDGIMPPPNAQKNFLPGSEYGKMVTIAADNVTVDGFEIRNVAGQPVGITADNAKLRNCILNFAYGGGIHAENVRAPLIENVVMTHCNQKRYDPKNTGGGPAKVQVNLLFKRVQGGVVRGCEIARNHGEGIGIAVESQNCIVENNTIHTNLHMHIVLNHAQNNIIRNNFIYHLKEPDFLQRSSGDAPIGILIADEMGRNQKLQLRRSEGNLIYNNIVVGMSQNFAARESKNSYGALRNTRIFNNTFVNAQRKSSPPINVRIPPSSEHANSFFENNLIVQDEGVIAQVGGGKEVLCRNNLWSREPPAAAKGPGDKVGNPYLQNHKAMPPAPTHFQLTSRSSLAIDAALKTNLTEDFFRAKRDGQPDIGAHEYNGKVEDVPEPPEPPGTQPRLKAAFRVKLGQRNGRAPHKVEFIDRSQGNIVKWAWKFGVKRSRSSKPNPTYTYKSPGKYTVSLTVTDSNGRTNTIVKKDFITVRQGGRGKDAGLNGLLGSAAEDGEATSVSAFRRFALYDVESDCELAVGVQFPDGSCVLHWAEKSAADSPAVAETADALAFTAHYDSIEEVKAVHLQPEVTTLEWLDAEEG